MNSSHALPRFTDDLEERLLRFDETWKHPGVGELQAACPPEAPPAFLIELLRIDAHKRVQAGMTVDESLYLQAFPALREQPTLLEQLRHITVTPLPLGDSVLRALALSSSVLQQVHLPDVDSPGTDVRFATSSSSPSLHRYKLEGEIARGGMGAVLRGRDEDLGREIAVKVMLQNHAGKTELLQRFVEEAQIAGQLQHPGITPVYELGRFPDQRPYFTMKLVRGQTLAKLLHDRPDAASERPRFLKVFEQICQTLAYAHTRKVIHRDLKPHNIMVGSFGEVQVMDWGLAKVMTAPAAEGATSSTPADASPIKEASVQTKRSSGNSTDIPNTQAGSILGTPAYMAPEQARGDIDQLDERADVFGLGAILCEILTGQPPYAGTDGRAIYQRAIDADLTDAHTRLQHCGADAELIALTQRCLAVRPADRPRDARALTAELTRYLHSVDDRLKQAELSAVQAKTQAEEESKRRRITFRLAAAILLTLLAGLAASVWQMRRALNAEELAKTNEDKAIHLANEEFQQRSIAQRRLSQIEKGNSILTGIFEDLDIRRIKEDGKTLEAILGERLRHAAVQLNDDTIADPLVVADMQLILGETLMGLGHDNDALKLFESSLTTRKKLLGAEHLDTLTSLNDLGTSFAKMGKLKLAIELAREYLEVVRRKYSDQAVILGRGLNNLGEYYRLAGQWENALPVLEEAVRLERNHPGSAKSITINLYNLGHLYFELGQFEKSRRYYEEALTIARKIMGPKHSLTLSVINGLAAAQKYHGRVDLALPLLEEGYLLTKERHGKEHEQTLDCMNTLGECYLALQRYKESIELFEEAFRISQMQKGEDDLATITYKSNLAKSYLFVGRVKDALPLIEDSLARRKKNLPPTHPSILTSMNDLASAYSFAGQPARAVPLYAETLNRRLKQLGDKHPSTNISRYNLGRALEHSGKLSEAMPYYEAAATWAEQQQFQFESATQFANVYADALELQQKYDQAETWRRKTLPVIKLRSGAESPIYLTSLATLGMNSIYQKKWVDAEQLLRECLTLRQKKQPDAWTTFNTMSMLGQSLVGQKKYSDAEPQLLKGYQGIRITFDKTPGADASRLIILQRLQDALDRLIQLYAETNKPEEVKKWQGEKEKLPKLPQKNSP